jgi:TP901 family phage tail tape measure protein
MLDNKAQVIYVQILLDASKALVQAKKAGVDVGTQFSQGVGPAGQPQYHSQKYYPSDSQPGYLPKPPYQPYRQTTYVPSTTKNVTREQFQQAFSSSSQGVGGQVDAFGNVVSAATIAEYAREHTHDDTTAAARVAQQEKEAAAILRTKKRFNVQQLREIKAQERLSASYTPYLSGGQDYGEMDKRLAQKAADEAKFNKKWLDTKTRFNKQRAAEEIKSDKEANKSVIASPKGPVGIEGAARRVLLWGASSMIIYRGLALFGQAISMTVTLDNAMTQMKKVMVDSYVDFEKMQQSLFGLAKTYGLPIQDMITMATIWAQQGYNAKDTIMLTEEASKAMMALNIDSATATDYLTAAMNVWSLSIGDLDHNLSMLMAVQAKYAIESKDLAVIFNRIGAGAREAGMSMEEVAGVSTALRASTRKSETQVATIEKTMYGRMFTPNVMKIIEGPKINIPMKIDAETYRPMVDILGDLANKWSTLDDVTRRSTALQVGGLRFWSDFVALMQNWGMAVDATKTAYEATDEAQKAVELQAGTLQNRLIKIQNMFVEVGTSWGKGMMGPITKLAGAFGTLAGFISKIPVDTLQLITISLTAMAGLKLSKVFLGAEHYAKARAMLVGTTREGPSSAISYLEGGVAFEGMQKANNTFRRQFVEGWNVTGGSVASGFKRMGGSFSLTMAGMKASAGVAVRGIGMALGGMVTMFVSALKFSAIMLAVDLVIRGFTYLIDKISVTKKALVSITDEDLKAFQSFEKTTGTGNNVTVVSTMGQQVDAIQKFIVAYRKARDEASHVIVPLSNTQNTWGEIVKVINTLDDTTKNRLLNTYKDLATNVQSQKEFWADIERYVSSINNIMTRGSREKISAFIESNKNELLSVFKAQRDIVSAAGTPEDIKYSRKYPYSSSTVTLGDSAKQERNFARLIQVYGILSEQSDEAKKKYKEMMDLPNTPEGNQKFLAQMKEFGDKYGADSQSVIFAFAKVMGETDILDIIKNIALMKDPKAKLSLAEDLAKKLIGQQTDIDAAKQDIARLAVGATDLDKISIPSFEQPHNEGNAALKTPPVTELSTIVDAATKILSKYNAELATTKELQKTSFALSNYGLIAKQWEDLSGLIKNYIGEQNQAKAELSDQQNKLSESVDILKNWHNAYKNLAALGGNDKAIEVQLKTGNAQQNLSYLEEAIQELGKNESDAETVKDLKRQYEALAGTYKQIIKLQDVIFHPDPHIKDLEALRDQYYEVKKVDDQLLANKQMSIELSGKLADAANTANKSIMDLDNESYKNSIQHQLNLNGMVDKGYKQRLVLMKHLVAQEIQAKRVELAANLKIEKDANERAAAAAIGDIPRTLTTQDYGTEKDKIEAKLAAQQQGADAVNALNLKSLDIQEQKLKLSSMESEMYTVQEVHLQSIVDRAKEIRDVISETITDQATLKGNLGTGAANMFAKIGETMAKNQLNGFLKRVLSDKFLSNMMLSDEDIKYKEHMEALSKAINEAHVSGGDYDNKVIYDAHVSGADYVAEAIYNAHVKGIGKSASDQTYNVNGEDWARTLKLHTAGQLVEGGKEPDTGISGEAWSDLITKRFPKLDLSKTEKEFSAKQMKTIGTINSLTSVLSVGLGNADTVKGNQIGGVLGTSLANVGMKFLGMSSPLAMAISMGAPVIGSIVASLFHKNEPREQATLDTLNMIESHTARLEDLSNKMIGIPGSVFVPNGGFSMNGDIIIHNNGNSQEVASAVLSAINGQYGKSLRQQGSRGIMLS